MTGARRWLVLGWLVAGQLGQKALAFGALHSDIHPARWQHLCTGAGHPRVQRARRTTDGRSVSEGPVPTLWTRSPRPCPCPRPYQKVIFRKSERKEQKVRTGFCFSQASTRGLGTMVGQGYWRLSSETALPPDLHSQVPQVGKCLLTQRGLHIEFCLRFFHCSSLEGCVAAGGRKVRIQPETHPTLGYPVRRQEGPPPPTAHLEAEDLLGGRGGTCPTPQQSYHTLPRGIKATREGLPTFPPLNPQAFLGVYVFLPPFAVIRMK